MSETSPDTGIQSADGHRRQVTVLFADIVDYTTLAERLGEEATFELIHRVTNEQNAAIEAEGGSVREFAGDGLMAIFGAPVALEDASLHACRAALDIQARIARVNEDVQLRIGIHTGPVVLGRMGEGDALSFTALGDSVNVAARLQQAAPPGGILISADVMSQVEGYAETGEAERRQLKGRAEEVVAHQLTGVAGELTRFDVSVMRGLSPLVGRGEELLRLSEWLLRAAGGAAQRINLTGDVGIGKSRLIHELRRQPAARDWHWLSGYCTAGEAGTPFQPFLRVLRREFGLTKESDRGQTERRLQRGMEALGIDAAPALPYLLNLLGFDVTGDEFRRENAELAGRRTRDLLLELIGAILQRGPTVLFIDDAHWLDLSSAQLLRRAVADRAQDRLLVICTYRAGIAVDRTDAADDLDMTLTPLSATEIKQLAAGRLGVERLPDALADLVAEKADGNPLFAEEIVDYLRREGRLSLAEGNVRFDTDLDEVLPASLENLLMRRVDQLDPPSRGFLEAAAVAGRDFVAAPVARVAGNDNLDPSLLQRLQEQNLIREADHGTWRFNSALVRDGLYDSLLRNKRAELHGEIADALENHFADRLADVAEELARHYIVAGNSAAAVRHLTVAGEKSLRVYALEDAADRYRQIMALVAEDPTCADDLTVVEAALNMARVYYYRADMAGVVDMLTKVADRFDALGSPAHEARRLAECGYAYAFSARPAEAETMLARSLTLAEQCGDDGALAHALLGQIWWHLYYIDPGPDALEVMSSLFAKTETVAVKAGNVWVRSKARLCMSVAGMFAARPDIARRHALDLMALSRETGDSRAATMGAGALIMVDAFTGDPELAIAQGQQAIDASLSPIDRMQAHFALLAAKVLLAGTGHTGYDPAALWDEGDDLRRRMKAGQAEVTANGIDSVVALAMVLSGQIADGVRLLEEAGQRYADLGYGVARYFEAGFVAQVYQRIATSTERPSMLLMLSNLWFFLKTLPRADSLARRKLEDARRLAGPERPSLYVTLTLDLGDLHRHKGRTAEARACYEEALPLARGCGADGIAARLEAGLAAL